MPVHCGDQKHAGFTLVGDTVHAASECRGSFKKHNPAWQQFTAQLSNINIGQISTNYVTLWFVVSLYRFSVDNCRGGVVVVATPCCHFCSLYNNSIKYIAYTIVSWPCSPSELSMLYVAALFSVRTGPWWPSSCMQSHCGLYVNLGAGGFFIATVDDFAIGYISDFAIISVIS